LSDIILSDEEAAAQRRKEEYESKIAEANTAAAEVRAEDAASSTDGADSTVTSPDGADAAVEPDPNRSHPSDDPATDAEKQVSRVKSGAERRPRGWLESDVKRVTDAFIQGQIVLDTGQYLTPHRLSKLVKELDNLDEAPSTGACAAVLLRWKEIGFAELYPQPMSFKDYTAEGRTLGLTALKEKRTADRKATRAAVKEAEKAAAAPVEAPAAGPAPAAPAAPVGDGTLDGPTIV
jgi:hypothetical protein